MNSSVIKNINAIYALEEVDPKTIRKLSSVIQKTDQNSISDSDQNIHFQELNVEVFLPFDREVSSIYFQESIEFLDISAKAKEALYKVDCKTIQSIDLEILKSHPKIPKGYLDEIERGITSYISPKEKATEHFGINYSKWLRSLLAGLSKKEAHLLLSFYGLEHTITLSPSESSYLRYISSENKKKQQQDLIEKISQDPSSQELFSQQFTHICKKFITPWIYEKYGIVSLSEIFEFLENIQIGDTSFNHFREIASNWFGKFDVILDNTMYSYKQSIFFSGSESKCLYQEIVLRLKEIFYAPYITYKYEELIQRLLSEFSVEWKLLDVEFLHKSLIYSPFLYIDRTENTHELIVHL